MIKGLRIGRVFGIEISIDPSWLVIAFLFAWSFYLQFGLRFEDLDQPVLIVMAGATALVFFGSVLLHELSHSVMARRLGVPVEGITLFLFGGVSKMKMEARKPRDEFLIAAVGPLTSLLLAGVFWLVVTLTSGAGRFLASLMIAIGILAVFRGDLGGLWMAAIGWFLLQAAGAADQDVVVRSFLRDVTARDLMSPELVSIPFDATVEQAVDDYFLRYDHSAFPVVSEDRSGLVTLRAVRQIPKDQWGFRQVWTAMTDLRDTCTVEPETPMNRVMERLREQEEDRVLVVNGGQILGIITPHDVARWVQRSQDLGLDPSENTVG